TVVTPNVAEAEALTGIHVDSMATAREAAKRLAGMGAAAVVIKGGHLTGPEAVDLLLHDGTFLELAAPRVDLGAIHGTGYRFASAIAAGLALGDDVPDAVQRAKRYISGAIEHSFAIGRGARILNHFWDPPSAPTL
ncbi:MAG TPA: PfkB family carbohydrate kinase, partial [Vicinamibacterales bacterium]